MAMHEIFVRNDYRVRVDLEEHKACIVKGRNSISVPLEPLTQLSTLAAKHLRMIGCDPGNYLNIGHTNQVLLKDAAPAWHQAIDNAQQIAQARDTSMIPCFWERLPGLLELREAEENFAAGARSASLLLEQGPHYTLPQQLHELRNKYPHAALYIRAEYVALLADEKLAERGRRAMALLLSGDSLEEVRALLPSKTPDNVHQNLRRSNEEAQ